MRIYANDPLFLSAFLVCRAVPAHVAIAVYQRAEIDVKVKTTSQLGRRKDRREKVRTNKQKNKRGLLLVGV